MVKTLFFHNKIVSSILIVNKKLIFLVELVDTLNLKFNSFMIIGSNPIKDNYKKLKTNNNKLKLFLI